MPLPSDEVVEAIHGDYTRVYQRTDIYEADGETLWMADAPVLDATVDVDQTRDERRSFSMQLDNSDGDFFSDPDGFWYDKIFKVYRGVRMNEKEALLLKFSFSRHATDSYVYYDISSVTNYTVQTGDRVEYDVKWITHDACVALDLVATDGTRFRTSAVDQNALSAHPSTDLNFQAWGKWYRRSFAMPAGLVGKTISIFALASEKNGGGDVKAMMRRIRITDPSGRVVRKLIWDGGAAPTIASYGSQPAGGTLAIQTTDWLTQLGTFMIDDIQVDSFPRGTSIVGRDFAGKLIRSKTPTDLKFPNNHPIEEIVEALALNGGITDVDLPLTGLSTDREFYFDRGTFRFEMMKQIANLYGYEVYFRPDGYLTMTPFQDPVGTPPSYYWEVGEDGNVQSYSKKTSPTFLYNHIVVTGGRSDQVPFFAEAINTEPTSPTRVARLGYITDMIDSAFVENVTQAQDYADARLKISALEQYDVDLNSIVVPYVDVGEIGSWVDPDQPGDPTSYLISTLSIPYYLGSMSATVRRVTVVG